jgi:hypothetical protein
MLKNLVQDGHEIGSHSVTHRGDVMQMQPDVEARDSRSFIENRIGFTVQSFVTRSIVLTPTWPKR